MLLKSLFLLHSQNFFNFVSALKKAVMWISGLSPLKKALSGKRQSCLIDIPIPHFPRVKKKVFLCLTVQKEADLQMRWPHDPWSRWKVLNGINPT